MNITIGKPCAISEKGGRINNEDYVFPSPEDVTTSDRLFLVCDGVGGAQRGEVASSLACESFHTYFSTFLEGQPGQEFINKAVRYVEARFDGYITEHPDAAGMGTTVCLAMVGQQGITIAHIGDSRIYLFRDGKIIHRTEDHSLVNSLVRLGQLTPDEAAGHPQRNVILRAIQGSEKPTEADVVLLEDIQAGDYLFMCTDGILEHFTDDKLEALFSSTTNVEEIKSVIMETCYDRTRDNFTFYIIPIQNVLNQATFKQNIASFFYSLA
ncbi:MAG: protein phosphatase 2C domain-containing protein [Tannerellaceae bacterium]|nr:protein phosphatase 2C domain-containing protein [Tannerellaceae bacterium]